MFLILKEEKMNRFNLTKEPWIPCLMLDGTHTEFNLLDTLTKAHEIKEITDDSPLVLVSLHRFLLAILHRNFGPKNYEEWKNLWRKQVWDEATLRTYFESWQSRFNLFDEERPFYQYPKVPKKDGSEAGFSPVELLMPEKSTGSTLFDHSFHSKKEVYAATVAARHLIARHSFSLAGGVNYPFNLSNGLLVAGFSVLAVGKNLFETLMLNLVIYNGDKPMPVQEDEEGNSLDKPFWERDELQQATEKDKEGTVPLGYLDYLTWQSRRIKLQPTTDFQSVKSCQLQQNFKLKDGLNIFDPFKIYIEGENGRYPLNLNPNKSLWRNSHTLFRQIATEEENANLFKHLAKISGLILNREIQGQRKYSFSIIGIINDQASVKTWVHENLPLPLDYFDENNLVLHLETAINFAEKIGDILEFSMKKLRQEIDPQAWSSSVRSVKPPDRPAQERKLANIFPAMSIYWSSLEMAFQRLLSEMPKNADEELREWFSTVDKNAKDALSQSADSLSGSAKEQKAIVSAASTFSRLRGKLLVEDALFRQFLPNSKSTGGTQ